MKSAFWLFVALCQCTELCAQGTVNFANSGPGYLAKVYEEDGTLLYPGSAWVADLYWAPGTVTDSRLLASLQQPTDFAAQFANAGLFFGGTRTIPMAPGSVITAQVRVWDAASGPSWEYAQLWDYFGARIGESILFQVVLGDATNPANLTGLNGHTWSVHPVPFIPEPSPAAFIFIGCALVLSKTLKRGPKVRKARA